MYLALFVMPWMLLYALSSLAMNHVASFKRYYGGQVVNWQKEQERNLAMQFSSDATPRFMAEQILRDLQLEGTCSRRTLVAVYSDRRCHGTWN